jgi:hypothetical protein
VVRGKGREGDPAAVVSGAQVVVLARGEISHAASERYLSAVRRLPEEARPPILRPRSSSATAVAEELLWSVE